MDGGIIGEESPHVNTDTSYLNQCHGFFSGVSKSSLKYNEKLYIFHFILVTYTKNQYIIVNVYGTVIQVIDLHVLVPIIFPQVSGMGQHIITTTGAYNSLSQYH